MARSQKKPKTDGFILYDVLYDDGSRSSNRKVATADLDSLNVEASAKAILAAQDRIIAEQSGRPRGDIKSISKSKIR